MAQSHEFLTNLAVVLCVAAGTTVLFARLRLPTVFGYITAGLIIGPNVPIPLVADEAMVHTLAALGVILLMFCLGLEFSLRRLLSMGPSATIMATLEVSLMLWLGYLAARGLGWSNRQAVFTGAIVAFSSTTIVARALESGRFGKAFDELIVGMLVTEDLLAITALALLTAFGAQGGISLALAGRTLLHLMGFLLGFLLVGLWAVPRFMRLVRKIDSPETTLIACMGLCFVAASTAKQLGYSGALGAFLAGSLIAQATPSEAAISELVRPVRDLFVAVFFVAVGMMIDPADAMTHWRAITVLTAVVVLGKMVAVGAAAMLVGRGLRLSVQAGMTLAQIGEFSFILAEVGTSSGATPAFLYPVAVSVSAATTLLTHALSSAAGPVASAIERRLPTSLMTFFSLYDSWLDRLRHTTPARVSGMRLRRRLFILAADVVLLASLLIGTSAWLERGADYLGRHLALGLPMARSVALAGATACAVPLCVGLSRSIRKLALLLANEVLPLNAAGQVDLAATPRRALFLALQCGMLLLLGAPFVAVTQPFVGTSHELIAVFGVLAICIVMFWRQAKELQGHVRAGAEVLMEMLSTGADTAPSKAHGEPHSPLSQALAGLGRPVSVRLDPNSRAVGRTLAEINLRSSTGATVLAIMRGHTALHLPPATEELRGGDTLALVGSSESVEKAAALLEWGAPPQLAK